ncbi:hypothetical protein Syun_009343 [Stephania yunnanensis]|uniref:Uncharacterized protein n=1 Tax=Stephania yunnanensis TaxID=152371 RepID=A0AAP0KGG1_9MAGN
MVELFIQGKLMSSLQVHSSLRNMDNSAETNKGKFVKLLFYKDLIWDYSIHHITLHIPDINVPEFNDHAYNCHQKQRQNQ